MSEAKYAVRVCDGTSCHVRKSKKIIKTIWKELGLSKEKTVTDDNKFSVELGQCFEICGPGPMMKINEELYEHLTPEKSVEIIRNLD